MGWDGMLLLHDINAIIFKTETRALGTRPCTQQKARVTV